MALHFQASKEKETLSVEEVSTESVSGDPLGLAVDIEVAKIARKNLTTSEGLTAAKSISGATLDNVEQEKRVEV
jgi:hypothetical protein